MKTINEWVDFNVLMGYETKRFTKEDFERIVNDKFIAVKVNQQNKPQLIWTDNYVCSIKFEAFEDDSPVMVFPRNPK